MRSNNRAGKYYNPENLFKKLTFWATTNKYSSDI